MDYFIYQIKSKFPAITDSYVGSTHNLTLRKHRHRQGCLNPNSEKYQQRLYTFMRANGSFENFEFHLLEYCQNITQQDARKKEQEWIDKLCPSLNCNKAYTGLTRKEYNNQVLPCVCGSNYRLKHKQRHFRTLKHKNFCSSVV